MSKVTQSDVKRIAELAKLDFDEEALSRFEPQFLEILDYFELLQAVETDSVAPTYHALFSEELATPLRDDSCTKSLEPERVLSQAPKQKENQFRVPKVIE